MRRNAKTVTWSGSFPPDGCRIRKVALSNKNSDKIRTNNQFLLTKAPSRQQFTLQRETSFYSHTIRQSLSNSSFLATFATLDAHKSCRKELLEGRTALYEWFERCKRDVGRNYERACGKGAAACARFLEELAGKLHEKTDPRVTHEILKIRQYIFN